MQQRRSSDASAAAVAPRPAVAAAPPAPTGFDLDAFLDASALGTARTGLAGASSPLPHGETIQAAFGRHDVGGVTAQVGGPAATASASLGATAYAHGDRVAFSEAPDLRLAAHEAAHVVQQRGGVQLQSASGQSGDAYEQHADRVADLVVSGCSAESELDTLAGGGGSHEAVQRFDSPNHIGIGNSVKGAPVKIYTIEFSPGEMAALPDYIGNVSSAQQIESMFTPDQVARMKSLLERGVEDAGQWDDATNGAYSKLAQSNSNHFAPTAGDGGDNFRDEFINQFSRALSATRGGQKDPKTGTIDDPHVLAYSAEHFLEDAFSAGHQVAAADVATRVEAVVDKLEGAFLGAEVGPRIWTRIGADIHHRYEFWTPLSGWHGLEEGEFNKLAFAGGAVKGQGGVTNAVRRAVHEMLGGAGVMVTSLAHPEPFELLGDHDLPKAGAGESVKALQLALTEARALLAKGPTIAQPYFAAKQLFERHCPVPTANGQEMIRWALEWNTHNEERIIEAVTSSMCATIDEVLGVAIRDYFHDVLRLVIPVDGEKGIPHFDPLPDEPGTPSTPGKPGTPSTPGKPSGGDVHAY